jgi:hypothetical protein
MNHCKIDKDKNMYKKKNLASKDRKEAVGSTFVIY